MSYNVPGRLNVIKQVVFMENLNELNQELTRDLWPNLPTWRTVNCLQTAYYTTNVWDNYNTKEVCNKPGGTFKAKLYWKGNLGNFYYRFALFLSASCHISNLVCCQRLPIVQKFIYIYKKGHETLPQQQKPELFQSIKYKSTALLLRAHLCGVHKKKFLVWWLREVCCANGSRSPWRHWELHVEGPLIGWRHVPPPTSADT